MAETLITPVASTESLTLLKQSASNGQVVSYSSDVKTWIPAAGGGGGSEDPTGDADLTSLTVSGEVKKTVSSTTVFNITSSAITTSLPTTINSNLTVNGNLIFTDITTVATSDPQLELAKGNTTDAKAIGVYGVYSTDGLNSLYTGYVRDPITQRYIFYDAVTTQPASSIPSSYSLANITVGTCYGNLVATTISGTLSTATQTNITNLGTLTALTMGGTLNMASNNITSGGTITATNLAGTLTTAAQANITSLGTLTGLTSSGQIAITTTTASTPSAVVRNTTDGNGFTIKACSPSSNERALLSIGSNASYAEGWLLGQSISSNTVKDFFIYDNNTGIQTTRLLLNTSGNLTIGASDLASTTYKTYINGNTFINGTLSGISTLTATTLAGTLSTVAQANITSVGTLTSLNSGQITVVTSALNTPSMKITNTGDGYGYTIRACNPTVNDRALISIGSDASFGFGWQLGQSIGSNTTKDFFIYDGNNSTTRILIGISGGVNIATGNTDSASTTYKLYVNGDSRIVGTLSGITTLTATTLAGALSTAAQTAITSVGTLTALTVSGVSAFAVGSVSAPSIYFTGATTSGLYSESANILDVAISGVKVAKFDSTGLIVNTTTSPQLYVTNNTAAAATDLGPAIALCGTIGAGSFTNTEFARIKSGKTNGADLDSNAYLCFLTLGSGTLTESFRIDNTQNIIVNSKNISGIVNLSATNLTGTLQTAAQANVTSLGTLSSLTVSGGISGTLSTAAQTNITSLGTLSTLTCSGSVNFTNSTASSTTLTLQNPSGGYGLSIKAVNYGITPGTHNNRAFLTLGSNSSGVKGWQFGQSLDTSTASLDFFLYDGNSTGFCRMLFNASGQATIGATDLAAALGNKLYVDGTMKVAGTLAVTGALTIAGTLSGVTTLTATTLAGTLSTAAQTSVTSLGTLTSLNCSGAVNFSNTASLITLKVQNPTNWCGIMIKEISASVRRGLLAIGSSSAENDGWQLGQSVSSNTTREFFLYDGNNSQYRIVYDASSGTSSGMTIGASNLAGTTYKLYVDGNSFVNGTLSGISTLTATTLAGTLSTAAQTNITSVGTLANLSTTSYINIGDYAAGTSGNIMAGVYTPTYTISTNVTSVSASVHHWMRIGNIVFIEGRITITPDSSQNNFTCTIPASGLISSNFTTVTNANGGGECYLVGTTTTQGILQVVANDTNDTIVVTAYTASSVSADIICNVRITYKII